MEVHEFEKTLMDRMEEAQNVLCWHGTVIPASQVRREWCRYVELQIEPAGWQAIWKLPRVICEALKVPYPTIVGGFVEQVLFDELKAVYTVTVVQDDDVHLPERHEVALIDLWPTIEQENDALNIETTADCVDRLRYFYTHVWLPWDSDSDDDRDWAEQHLKSRIQLACELSNRRLTRQMNAHIRSLLAEARYIQARVEYYELDLDEDDEDGTKNKENETAIPSKLDKEQPDQSVVPAGNKKSHVTDLMRLHLRLAIIRSEMEILENAEMRAAYGDLKAHKQLRPRQQRLCFIVMQPRDLETQVALLQLARLLVAQQCAVQPYASLQDALAICEATDDILLAPGQHTVKFLERLNDKGSISGLVPASAKAQDYPVISSSDDDSILLVIDGDFTMSQLTLDCQQVRTGILLKGGKLCLRRCRLTGNAASSTQQAIICGPNSELVLDECIIENFAIGLGQQYGGDVSCDLRNVTIRNCCTGIELLEQDTGMRFSGDKTVFDTCETAVYIDVEDAQSLQDAAKFSERYVFKNCKRDVFAAQQPIVVQKKARKALLTTLDASFEQIKDQP